MMQRFLIQQAKQDISNLLGETQDLEDYEPFLCSVCNLNAYSYCSACDEEICEICGVKDEGIVFCYECWTAREAELTQEEEQEP